MKTFAFKLYITGQSIHSQKAVENLNRLRETMPENDSEITVVDVLLEPEQADQDKILATPTLIRTRPLPARRVIGDLSDLAKVVSILGLNEPANNIQGE